MSITEIVIKKNKSNVDNTKEHKVISICSGSRGIERGVERVIDIRTVVHVEIEAFIIENLAKEMEEGLVAPAPIWTDLKTFDGSPFRNQIHGIVGGYPCQPFSHAGQRNGTKDPRHLWPYISKLIKSVRPLWCFFENVEGHLTMGYGEVYRSLRDMGYKVETGIFSAEEVGAPHQRKRLFILAILDDPTNRGLFQCKGSQTENKKQEPRINRELENGFKGSSELGNSKSINGNIPKTNQRHENSNIERASKTMGNTNQNESRRLPKRTKEKKPIASINGQLANTTSQRDRESSINHKTGFTNKTRNKWPARPGQQQYEWEEPRTISKEEFESRLGSSTNGYNFRTDLLRMYGNGVVPQTAEKAFITLLKKHNE